MSVVQRVQRRVGPPYRGFSADTSGEDARASFERRFGRPPVEMIRSGGAVLVGPVPERKGRWEEI